MRFVALALLILTAVTCFAATGEKVSYPSGNETVNGLLYAPQGKGPHPALIVIHEWWGLDNWIKEQASKLADQGYVTLAVDLYRGKTASTRDEAHELSRGLPEDRAKRDLHAAFAYLKSRKDVDPKRIGSIGWCMGGGHSLSLALMEPTLAASVIKYGHLATDEDQLKKVNAAVLGVFGGQDRGIPVEDVKRFEQQMKQLGKKVEVVIYPQAGHAFENPNNKTGYRPQDAEDAWKKTIEFLDANLKKPGARKAWHTDDYEEEDQDARRVPVRVRSVEPVFRDATATSDAGGHY
ncbi:MAG TPA: dienelactone hydrolase family protein [Terriglobales bacterium]|nr:dienelactone hydrolase family protein [Terriglobales bacterium]